jgi:glutamyl-tRNA synthetase
MEPNSQNAMVRLIFVIIVKSGFIPEALLNYLVRLGWSSGNQEVFSIEEMIKLFDLPDINQSASAFSGDKLLWLNQEHMMSTEAESLVSHFKYQLDKIEVDINQGPDLVESN